MLGSSVRAYLPLRSGTRFTPWEHGTQRVVGVVGLWSILLVAAFEAGRVPVRLITLVERCSTPVRRCGTAARGVALFLLLSQIQLADFLRATVEPR